MPLRDDLLQPIAGERPSGANLQYDKVFEQIKEARTEDDESLPTGDWVRPPKKADRLLVIKLASETLAQRTKDLRLMGWYLESLVRKEGFAPLPGGLDILWKLQEQFWETLHPELDEDGSADLRIGAVETASTLLAAAVKLVPLTRSGVNWTEYQDAKAEDDGSGQLTVEERQKSVDGTPKQFYLQTEELLAQSLVTLSGLDEFQRERYGADYPSVGRIKTAIEKVKDTVDTLLAEKRKADGSDVVVVPPDATAEDEIDTFSQYDDAEPDAASQDVPLARPVAAAKRKAPTGAPTDEQSAYDQIAAAAEFLRTLNGASAVPYLVCSSLRLGEARTGDVSDASFAVAPATETRQALRRLANEGSWDEVWQLCLRTMTETCGRTWLDLQRYAWRAASELGHTEQAKAIAGTVRSLLQDVPALREAILDDDTPAANKETNDWIDAEVLPPVPDAVVEDQREAPPKLPMYVPEVPVAADVPLDVYATAIEVLRGGRVGQAINLLVRDAAQQPSGRMRFLRRVQMAELCLAAEKPEVAYPVLRDLSGEMERRSLDTWEAAETLAQPLALLLQCLDQRTGSESEREAVFERLCRLDPQAALEVRR